MFNIISKNKLKKIRKRGTYSRLLKKYRDRYKEGLQNNELVKKVNDQPTVLPSVQDHTEEIDTHDENVIIEEHSPTGKYIVR